MTQAPSRPTAIAVLAVLVAGGCANVVHADASAAATGSGGAAGANPSDGGAAVVGVTIGASSGAGISGGRGVPCDPDYMTVAGDGETKTLDHRCDGRCPLAFTYPHGAMDASALVVSACDSEVAILLDAWIDGRMLGMHSTHIEYSDASANAWFDPDGWIVLTEADATTDFVAGSFGGTLSSASGTLELSGTFAAMLAHQ